MTAVAPGMQTRALSVRAGSVDAEAMTVRATIATEQPVEVLDFERFEVIDEVLLARGAELPTQVPFLDSHSRASVGDVLGSVRGFTREGKDIAAELHFDDGDERGRLAFGKVQRSHLTDVSVGYRVLERTMLDKGATQTVGGRSYTATDRPLAVVTRWAIREVSLVPIGADDKAKIREAFEAGRRAARATEVRTREGAMTHQEVAPGEERQAPSIEKPQADVQTSNDDYGGIRKAVASERERVASIMDMAGDDVPVTVRDEAIRAGLSREEAGVMFLEAIRSRTPEPVASAPTVMSLGNYERTAETNLKALQFGIRHQAGLTVEPLERQPGDSVRKSHERAAEEGWKYRDLSLSDYVREAVFMATGKRVLGTRSAWQEFIGISGASQVSRYMGQRAGGFATPMDLANLFTDNVNVAVQQRFRDLPDSTVGWTLERDNPDFRSNERPRARLFTDLQKLPSGQVAHHMTMDDIGESYKVRRYAGQWQVDEQDIINDRFGIFTETPQMAADAANRIRPDLVYYILLNGGSAGLAAGALFSSGNSNTATNALSSANLITGIAAMRTQTEVDGAGASKSINVVPRYLICAATLDHTAKELMNSSLIVVAGSTDTVRGNANTLQNSFEVVSDARIDNGVTDPATGTAASGSTTAWYLAGDPNLYPTLEVGFIRGTGRSPRVRSEVLTQGRWGIGYDVSHDVAAKALAYQGLYRGNT